VFGFFAVQVGFVVTNALNIAANLRMGQQYICLVIGAALCLMALTFPVRIFVSVLLTKRKLLQKEQQQPEADLKQVTVQA
jgi:hypothetical protein